MEHIREKAIGLAAAAIAAALLVVIIIVFAPVNTSKPVQPEPIEGSYCWMYIHPENFPICRD